MSTLLDGTGRDAGEERAEVAGPGWADRLHRRAERLAPVGLGLLVTFVVLSAAVAAARRPLWNDELFTYSFGHLPDTATLWRELGRGAEQTPPGFYLVTQASIRLFGGSDLALRAPEIAGFAVATCCTYAVAARRTSSLYGLIAALVLVCSSARAYAFEARPYALVMACAGLALVSWQRATDGGTGRRAGLVGLAASLAAAVAFHYYAVLLLLPFGAALVVHARTARRVDRPLLLALLLGLTPLAVFSPLIVSSYGYSATFWAVPRWLQPIEFFGDVAGPVLSLPLVSTPVVAVAVAVVAGTAVALRRRPAGARAPARLPGHEVVLVVTLALLPFAGIVVAKLVTGAFVSRYVISAVLALAVVAGVLLHHLGRRLVVAGPVAVCALAVAGAWLAVADVRRVEGDHRRRTETAAFLEAESGGEQVVIASSHEFFELSHDAARGGGGPGLVYLADPESALRWLGTDTVEGGLVQLQDFAPLQVAAYERYLATHGDFLLYGEQLDWDWVTGQLRADGYRFEVQALFGSDPLYRVSPPTRRPDG